MFPDRVTPMGLILLEKAPMRQPSGDQYHRRLTGDLSEGYTYPRSSAQAVPTTTLANPAMSTSAVKAPAILPDVGGRADDRYKDRRGKLAGILVENLPLVDPLL